MGMNQLFAKKSLKVLLDEMAGEHRLKRVLGPVTLTALGIASTKSPTWRSMVTPSRRA